MVFDRLRGPPSGDGGFRECLDGREASVSRRSSVPGLIDPGGETAAAAAPLSWPTGGTAILEDRCVSPVECRVRRRLGRDQRSPTDRASPGGPTGSNSDLRRSSVHRLSSGGFQVSASPGASEFSLELTDRRVSPRGVSPGSRRPWGPTIEQQLATSLTDDTVDNRQQQQHRNSTATAPLYNRRHHLQPTAAPRQHRLYNRRHHLLQHRSSTDDTFFDRLRIRLPGWSKPPRISGVSLRGTSGPTSGQDLDRDRVLDLEPVEDPRHPDLDVHPRKPTELSPPGSPTVDDPVGSRPVTAPPKPAPRLE